MSTYIICWPLKPIWVLKTWKLKFKGGPGRSHLIFEINVGKRRIRHRTTLKMNFWIDSKSFEDGLIYIQSRCMSDPTLSDIDFKNKVTLVWTSLNIKLENMNLISIRFYQVVPMGLRFQNNRWPLISRSLPNRQAVWIGDGKGFKLRFRKDLLWLGCRELKPLKYGRYWV